MMHTMTIKVEDSVISRFQAFLKTNFPKNKVQIIADVIDDSDEEREILAMSNISANTIEEWKDSSEDEIWK